MTDLDHERNLAKTVPELDTSVRLANVLDSAARELSEADRERGLPAPVTVGDIAQWSEHDLLRLPHMGKRLLRELTKLLEQEGTSLRDPRAPIVRTGTDQVLAATNAVVAALRGLPVDRQLAAVRAACTILGVHPGGVDP